MTPDCVSSESWQPNPAPGILETLGPFPDAVWQEEAL